MSQYTFTIIKPDAYQSASQISNRITFEGFKVLGMRATMLTPEQAEEFYAIHKGKDFYWLRKDLKKTGSTNIFIYDVAIEKITNTNDC